jgi:hypothetical protein
MALPSMWIATTAGAILAAAPRTRSASAMETAPTGCALPPREAVGGTVVPDGLEWACSRGASALSARAVSQKASGCTLRLRSGAGRNRRFHGGRTVHRPRSRTIAGSYSTSILPRRACIAVYPWMGLVVGLAA